MVVVKRLPKGAQRKNPSLQPRRRFAASATSAPRGAPSAQGSVAPCWTSTSASRALSR
jgi:hypothetical protein